VTKTTAAGDARPPIGNEVARAEWLVSAAAQPWLDRAAAETDPSSLAAATRLRRELPAELAAAVLDQVALRRRARAKLGDLADRLFLTRSGLEQATRPAVAAWRAERLRAAGVTELTDAGAGLGIDAAAALAVGLRVRAIERDPVTAVYLAANLGQTAAAMPASAWSGGPPLDDLSEKSQASHGDNDQPSDAPPYEVVIGAIEDLLDPRRDVARDDQALFLDPSRRTPQGRSWRLDDLTPAWSTVTELRAASVGPVVVKLGPGTPHSVIPDDIEAIWVSHAGDLVELGLWQGPLADGQRSWPRGPGESTSSPQPGEPNRSAAGHRPWSALLLPSGDTIAGGGRTVAPGPLGAYLWEPNPAVIRAAAVGELADRLGAHPVAAQVAYLTGDTASLTPFATAFDVLDVLPCDTKAVRAWVRREGIGALEIKTRGLGLDPAEWRRHLGLRPGSRSATLICTPTERGAVALVARRRLATP
jgi:hypothetical protein